LFPGGGSHFSIEFGVHEVVEDDFEVLDEFLLLLLTLNDLFLLFLELLLEDSNRDDLIIGENLVPEVGVINIWQGALFILGGVKGTLLKCVNALVVLELFLLASG
jgi:hypothetical protein